MSTRPDRPRPARLLALLACVLILCLAGGGAQARDAALDLDAQQSVRLGREILAAGRPKVALALARAIVDSDPSDPGALVLMAAALQQLDAHDRARDTAHRAYATARTDRQAFESAMLAGRADFRRDAYTRAQLWLRRAAQAAPDATAREIAERNFKRVRQVNPLTLRFRLGLRSSSNINDGSGSDEIEIFGLPFRVRGSSQALSGTELTVGAALRYRIARSKRHATFLTTEIATRSYRLSQSARRKAPEASGSDFSYQRVELGARHRVAGAREGVAHDIAGAVGRTWYGGRRLSDYARLRLSRRMRLQPATQLRLTLSLQGQRRHDSDARSAVTYGLQGEIAHRLQGGARLIVLGSARRTESDARDIRNTALRARAIYELAEPIFGVRLSSSISVEHRRYPVSVFAQSERRDLRAKLGISAAFEAIDYMGFTPSWNIELSRTESTAAFYDQESVDMFLGIRSSF